MLFNIYDADQSGGIDYKEFSGGVFGKGGNGGGGMQPRTGGFGTSSGGADLLGATADDGVCTECSAGLYQSANSAHAPCETCRAGFAYTSTDATCAT